VSWAEESRGGGATRRGTGIVGLQKLSRAVNANDVYNVSPRMIVGIRG
jgi:hypothetical protein